MGPIWVLSAPDGPHVGPMILFYQGIHIAQWGVIPPPSLNFNVDLVKPPLKLGQGQVITYHTKL